MPAPPPPEQFTDLHFPCAGLDRSRGFNFQPVRQVEPGVYSRSTASCANVRAYEVSTDRRRGGSRGGLSKFVNAQVAGTTWVVQHLALVVGSGYSPPGGSVVQASQSGRVVTLVAVSQGNVYALTAGGTSWSQAANASGQNPPLNFSGVMQSAVNNQRLWFADGINYAYYDPKTHAVYRWQASTGSLPVDSAGNTPRLICTWRGRTVLSGLLLDPQNWFMTRIGDPTDLNYKPLSFSPAQAIAGNNAPQGLIGDVITTLIPWSDDLLVFGGDHTIWVMRGDPCAGGQIDRVSDVVGMAWATAWAKDPEGNIYFLSNKTGLYQFDPRSGSLVRISQAIEQDFDALDTGNNLIHMQWNDEFQGLHLFVTPAAAPAATTHFFWEKRTGGWWPDTFGNNDLNPLCSCVFDGNLPGDRRLLIGCWDGYVRSVDKTAPDDDGTPIAGSVFLGPFLTKNFDEVTLQSIQAIMGATSGQVTWQIYVGATAEAALASSPLPVTGTWAALRNLTEVVRRGGHAIYLRLTSSVPWALEAVRALLISRGDVRMRGR